MSRTGTVGIMTVGIMTVAIAAAGAARAGDELPRYRLEPGMELTYKGSSAFRHQSGMHLDDEETTAWIVRRNGDGSVRVVLRQGSRFTATSVAETLKSLFKKQAKPPMDYNFGYFDLFPDGRLGPDAELGYRINPASLFPRLPDDQANAKAGWGQRDERMGQEYRYSALRDEPGGWAFRAERIGPENKVYGMTMDSTFHLDTKRGAIRRIEQEYTQDYGFKGKGTGSMELTAVETRDAAWLASFAPAADRYFAASKAYERATEDASKDAAKANALLADAKAALKSAPMPSTSQSFANSSTTRSRNTTAWSVTMPTPPSGEPTWWANRRPNGTCKDSTARRILWRNIAARSWSLTSGIAAAAGASRRCHSSTP